MKIERATLQQRQQGSAYSLIEVLVATLVVATAAVAFNAALSSGFGFVQAGREDLRAIQIMSQKAEALRLCNWDQISSFSFRDTYDPLGVTNHTAGTTYFGNVVTNAASSIPNTASYAGDVRLVTISVSWTNYNGKTPVAHSRQMYTQVARYGLQNYVWGLIP